jgi:hypothetical protein
MLLSQIKELDKLFDTYRQAKEDNADMLVQDDAHHACEEQNLIASSY